MDLSRWNKSSLVEINRLERNASFWKFYLHAQKKITRCNYARAKKDAFKWLRFPRSETIASIARCWSLFHERRESTTEVTATSENDAAFCEINAERIRASGIKEFCEFFAARKIMRFFVASRNYKCENSRLWEIRPLCSECAVVSRQSWWYLRTWYVPLPFP